MIDISKLPEDVLDDIKQNHSESEIKNLSVEEAFEAFCNWQNLIGFSATLIRGLDAIRAASDEKMPNVR